MDCLLKARIRVALRPNAAVPLRQQSGSCSAAGHSQPLTAAGQPSGPLSHLVWRCLQVLLPLPRKACDTLARNNAPPKGGAQPARAACGCSSASRPPRGSRPPLAPLYGITARNHFASSVAHRLRTSMPRVHPHAPNKNAAGARGGVKSAQPVGQRDVSATQTTVMQAPHLKAAFSLALTVGQDDPRL